MAALAACDDSPVGPSWVEVSQGAEARVYRLEVFGVAAVAKHRFKKTYRLEAVDLKLRKERTVAEARCLARCSDLGLPVPAVLVADTARYTLYLEFVPGPTAKPSPSSCESLKSRPMGVVWPVRAQAYMMLPYRRQEVESTLRA